MRIAVTHVFCWPEVRRGAERMIAELSRALNARGHEVTVFTTAYQRGRSVEDGVSWVRLRRSHDDIWDAWRHFGRRVWPELILARPDAVHSHGLWDCTAAIRTSKLRPRQRTVFTDLGLPIREWWNTIGPWALRRQQYVADKVDVYGGMSSYAVKLLKDNFGRDGVVTPGGVNLEEMVPAPSRAVRPVLLFSGAVTEPRKGVATLLEALPAIAEAEPGVELWLSGPGDPTALLDAAPPAARSRTKVLGLGQPGEQAARYGTAWATVLPSTNDSFGQALLESLACGTPLVASTHAAVPELVTPGLTGSLCEPGDPVSLAAACLESIELARKPETTEACREFARPYDWLTGLAPRYERYYSGEAP
jgi:glycosyltransferase involved in cell wall biosynthesis